MKTFGKVLVLSMFAFVITLTCIYPLWAQVIITSEDIPTEVGYTSYFYVEVAEDTTGIPIDLGNTGGNNYWDFSTGATDMVISDSLLNPQEAPSADLFPTSNRVSTNNGVIPFQLGSVNYEYINENSWLLLGMDIDNQAIPEAFRNPFALENPVTLLEFPLEYEDTWNWSDTINYFYSDDTLTVDSLRIEIIFGGYSEIDAWGTGRYSNQEVDVLRGHFFSNLTVTVYAIQTFMGQIIEVRLFDLINEDASHSYVWYSPDIGDIAFASSFPGELEPDFTHALSVRRRFIPGEDSVSEFDHLIPETIVLYPVYPNPFNNQTNIRFSLNRPQYTDISVYNLNGQFLEYLYQGVATAGLHQLNWNAADYSTGTYYLIMNSANKSSTQKLTLIK